MIWFNLSKISFYVRLWIILLMCSVSKYIMGGRGQKYTFSFQKKRERNRKKKSKLAPHKVKIQQNKQHETIRFCVWLCQMGTFQANSPIKLLSVSFLVWSLNAVWRKMSMFIGGRVFHLDSSNWASSKAFSCDILTCQIRALQSSAEHGLISAIFLSWAMILNWTWARMHFLAELAYSRLLMNI